MLCTSGGVLKDYNNEWKLDGGVPRKQWKTEGVSTCNLATSSWVNDIRGTEQEKLVEQAMNLDLNNLSEKQLVDLFVAVTDEPECKAQGYIYGADNDLIAAFQKYFLSHNKRDSQTTPSPPPPPDSFTSDDSYCEKEPCVSLCKQTSKDFATPAKRPPRQQRDSFSKDCDHRCCMLHADACCGCSDSRTETDTYDIYIKDEGICTTRYRWLFYCPVCKRRTQARSPLQSTTYAPLYMPKARHRTCSKHKVCPPSCCKSKDSCIIC